MEKQVQGILELFRQGLARADNGLLLQAVRRVSSQLPLSHMDDMTSHPQIIKMLIICAPISGPSIMLLLESLLNKYKNRQYVIFSIWKIFERIAELQNKNASSILRRLSMLFDGDDSKRVATGFEEEYLRTHLWDMKRNVLQLVPQLFSITYEKSPSDVKDRLGIFKLFRAECKNPEMLLQISRLHQEVRVKYCPDSETRKGREIGFRTEKRKPTQKKLLGQQDKQVEDRLLIERYLRQDDDELLSLLKSQGNMEIFLSVILQPKICHLEKEIWCDLPGDEATWRKLRSKNAISLLSNQKSYRKLVATCPQFFSLFVGILQRAKIEELNLDNVQQLIGIFMTSEASTLTHLLMKHNLIDLYYQHLSIPQVYKFMHRILTIPNTKQLITLQLKKIYYEYLRSVNFFSILISNTYRIKKDKIPLLKNQQLSEFESALKKHYSQKRKQKTMMISCPDAVEIPEDAIRSSTTTFFQKKWKFAYHFFKKVDKEQEGIIPTFAQKDYKGYYSSSPAINFFTIEPERVGIDNEQWHLLNAKMYYHIVLAIQKRLPPEIQKSIIPDSKGYSTLFKCLKKYMLLEGNHSVKYVVRILNILLENADLPNLCQEYLPTMYQLIHLMFVKACPPTRLLRMTVYKTISSDCLHIVQLLSQMLSGIEPKRKTYALDQVQEDMWRILMLWFFDCTLNTIYQCLFYEIMSQVITHGSECLLVKLLFKYNMLSCLHNAYDSIIKDGVPLLALQIDSFQCHIVKIHSLLRQTVQMRQLNIVGGNLNQMASWHLLSKKIKERKDRHIGRVCVSEKYSSENVLRSSH